MFDLPKPIYIKNNLKPGKPKVTINLLYINEEHATNILSVKHYKECIKKVLSATVLGIVTNYGGNLLFW